MADDELGSGYQREETHAETLDRNYSELLQELRVAETGVQVLFAFLLGIAFQQRFADTDTFQRGVYIFTLVCSAISTALLIAPVAYHRLVFHQRRKDELVRVTNLLVLAGASFLLVAVLGAVLLVTDFVVNLPTAIVLVAVLAVVFGWFWFALPLRRRMMRNLRQAKS